MGRYALLVATSEYNDPELRVLRAPGTDSRQLAELFGNHEIGRFDEVRILYNEPKQAIEESVEDLFSAGKPGDVIVLYLSCHGVKDDRGRLFFATAQSRLRRPASTAVSASFVAEQVKDSRAGGKIVLLDCCYSGAFAKGFDSRASADGDLSQQVQGRGSYVMTASDALEYAYEGEVLHDLGSEHRSVFTGAIIDGIRTGAADLDGDGVITAQNLFGYVEEHVRDSGLPQSPTFFATGARGDVPVAYAVRASGQDPFSEPKLPLDSLFSGLEQTAARGLSAVDWPGAGGLVVPLGKLYDPVHGWQQTMQVDLSAGAGHVAVCGGPFSGKSTALCTFACSLALTHSPDEVQLYGLREGIEGLAQLASLPHVGMVAEYADRAAARQIIEGAVGIIERRTRLCERLGIRSARAYRARRASGQLKSDGFGEIFIFVDSWELFASRLPDLAQQSLRIAQAGLRYGVHLVVSASRWQEFPEELARATGMVVELTLTDPRDSFVDTELAAGLPRGAAGFGLSRERKLLRVAAPELVGTSSSEDGWEGLDELVSRIRDGWSGPAAAPLERPAPPDSRRVELWRLHGWSGPTGFDLATGWAPRPARQRLRIPIGVDEWESPVELDLKDPARGGDGPHGLVVGAAGSGLPELLRTIALGLAATHPPDQLSFVFLDGGSETFLGLQALPHTAALILNVQAELPLLDHFSAAMAGELSGRRRQLRVAGNYSSLRAYQAARENGADLAAIPSLLLVVNEFTEILAARPSFRDLFAQIYREGRALGVHVLVASERVESAALQEMGGDFSYRIALRTASAGESRAVLGVPDAYELPSAPGRGYLKVAGNRIAQFATASTDHSTTLREVLVPAMEGVRSAEQFWLPPLAESPALSDLLPALARTKEHGLSAERSHELTAVVGTVDQPAEKRRYPLRVDLSKHVGIMGTHGSGKSTFLRSLVCSLALTHTPQEVQFLCLDFGTGQLGALARLPHVAGVASSHDADLIRRALAIISGLLNGRARFFTDHGISTMSSYRELGNSDDVYGDVFLVIDDLGVVRREFDLIEDVVRDIAVRGPVYGIHLIGTYRRPIDVRMAVQDAFGTTIELRLAEPYDSQIDRKAAALIPENRPGQGVVAPGLHFVGALPRIDGRHSSDDVDDGLKDLVDSVAAAWEGPPAPPVLLLPNDLSPSDLPSTGTRALQVPIGIDEDKMATVLLDFAQDSHFLVLGDKGSGKSNLLRSITRSIITTTSPSEARVILLDYRRAMLDLASNEHVIGYAPTAASATAMLGDARQSLEKRLPTADVTPEQLHDRSWWKGPELFVIVDNYELFTMSGTNPLTTIVEFVQQAKDVGLHIVLARATAGASRAMYDPILQRMKDVASPALIMSSPKDEGSLYGTVRPQRLPPGRGTLVTWRDEPKLIQTMRLDGVNNF